MKNIEDKVKDTDQSTTKKQDDIDDDDYLMQNIVGDDQESSISSSSPYELEYNDVISDMSSLCLTLSYNSRTEVKEKKSKIE